MIRLRNFPSRNWGFQNNPKIREFLVDLGQWQIPVRYWTRKRR